jgi:hypothetical protein
MIPAMMVLLLHHLVLKTACPKLHLRIPTVGRVGLHRHQCHFPQVKKIAGVVEIYRVEWVENLRDSIAYDIQI